MAVSSYVDNEKFAKIVFKILKVKQRPMCQRSFNPMYVPFNKEENKCFNIGEMFEKDPTKYARGKSTKKQAAIFERIQNKLCKIDSPEEAKAKSGLAITKASNGFKYKCNGDNELIDLVIADGKALPLTRDCCLQFEAPERTARSTEDLSQAVSFTSRAFDGTSQQIQSKVPFDKTLFESDDSFGEHDMAAEVLKESCKDVLGETCGDKELPCPEGQVKDSKISLL